MTTQHLDRPAMFPADWYPDPVGRHQYRFYDGLRWTDHVADDGRVQHDPLKPAPPLAPTIVTPADEAAFVPPQVTWPETGTSMPQALPGDGPASTLKPGLPGRPAAGPIEAVTAEPPAATQPAPTATSSPAPTPTPHVTPPATEPARPAPAPMFSLDEAVRRCLRGYVSFTGRASRSEYWWFALTANLVLGVVAFAGLALLGGLIRDPDVAFVVGTLPYSLLSLGLLPAMLSAAVRRLHDTGQSGALLLLGLIPLVGPVIVVAFLASPGTPSENKYGAIPTPVDGSPDLMSTFIAAARIPLQYLLVGIASLTVFRLVSRGHVGPWGLSFSGLTGWLLTMLTIAAAVALMFAMRHSIPSRWLLWIEVAAAAVIAAAPLGAGATLWFDWPELLGAPLLIFGRLLAMAWLGVVLVSAFPRLQATPGSTPPVVGATPDHV